MPRDLSFVSIVVIIHSTTKLCGCGSPAVTIHTRALVVPRTSTGCANLIKVGAERAQLRAQGGRLRPPPVSGCVAESARESFYRVLLHLRHTILRLYVFIYFAGSLYESMVHDSSQLESTSTLSTARTGDWATAYRSRSRTDNYFDNSLIYARGDNDRLPFWETSQKLRWPYLGNKSFYRKNSADSGLGRRPELL